MSRTALFDGVFWEIEHLVLNVSYDPEFTLNMDELGTLIHFKFFIAQFIKKCFNISVEIN